MTQTRVELLMMVSRPTARNLVLLIWSPIQRFLPDETLYLTMLFFLTALFVNAVSGALHPAGPTSQPHLGPEERVYDPAPAAAGRPFDTLVHRAFPEYAIRVKESSMFCVTTQTCGRLSISALV